MVGKNVLIIYHCLQKHNVKKNADKWKYRILVKKPYVFYKYCQIKKN